MVNRWVLALCLAPWLTLHTGCAKTVAFDSANQAGQVGTFRIQLTLPQGSQIHMEDSLILGTGDDWLGRVVLTAPLSPSESFTYFSQEYPKQGWQLISRLVADESTLILVKAQRTMIIRIAKAGTLRQNAKVQITVSPTESSQGVNAIPY